MQVLETGQQAKTSKSGREYFFLFFSNASERRVWLSAESKILVSTIGRFACIANTVSVNNERSLILYFLPIETGDEGIFVALVNTVWGIELFWFKRINLLILIF